MERLEQLLGKLNEQFQQNADPSQLLVTTQLIEAELIRLSTTPQRVLGTSKISVVMPVNSRAYGNRPETAVKEEVTEIVTVTQPIEEKNDYHRYNGSQNGNGSNGKAKEEKPVPAFDPLKEIPTLAHQHTVKELNDVMASKDFSLNEKLKEDVKEVAHLLNDSPVRDLRKAIGINDRFVFVSELFRGDEVMYERSIKTINGFRILPEAEYWIERELKVKLGWDENREATRHFYQIIKRRFS